MWRHPLIRRPAPAQEPEPQEQGAVSIQEGANRQQAPYTAETLQRTIGNRRLGRLLNQGRPLDTATRQQMEAVLGRDLSLVRLHTDGAASRFAAGFGAEAFASGEEIGFAPGRYQPGTPLGDALLAHELAHVAQQQQAAQPLTSSSAREQEANRQAARVVGARWPGLRAVAGRIADALPTRRPAGVGRGVQLASCFSSEKTIEPPSFLGPDSLETWNIIKNRIESAGLLRDMLVAGPLIVLLTSSPLETAAGGGYPLEQQVNAVRAVDVILRSRITQDIELLLVTHDRDLSREEKLYWERLLDRLNRAGSSPEGEVKGK